jgi:hypothetical protein
MSWQGLGLFARRPCPIPSLPCVLRCLHKGTIRGSVAELLVPVLKPCRITYLQLTINTFETLPNFSMTQSLNGSITRGGLFEFNRRKVIVRRMVGWLYNQVEQQLRQGLKQAIEKRVGFHPSSFSTV